MGILRPKRTAVTPDESYGICVWQFPNGQYLKDRDGNHFCAQARVGSPIMERKMRAAVEEMGVKEGKPMWLPGFRVISEMEWEDQMADLLDGKVPDAVDLYRQVKNEG